MSTEHILPPLDEPRPLIHKFAGVDHHAEASLREFKRRNASHESRKVYENISIYQLGQTSAFLLRTKSPLSIDEYMNVFHDNFTDNLGIALFPAGEGTEVSGFVNSEEGVQKLLSLRRYFNISFGLSSPQGPSLLEYDEDNNFSNLGCASMVAAARGSYSGEELGVWELFMGDQTEGTTSGYSGYKGTKLIKRTIDEIVPADSFFSDAIPKQADSLDFRYFDGYIVKGFGRVNVAKIDINQFTNNLLSKTPREQEDYVAKCCNFFHDVELALKELYAHRDKKYDIFLGSRTADSTIFYFKNDQDRESIEEKIRLAQGKHGVDIKTVGKVVTGVTLHSWADDAGHDEWSRRIFHSTKPVSELDWRDLEIAAVAANKEDPQQSPQYKIFFSE